MSFTKAVYRPLPLLRFKVSSKHPELINGKLGISFSEAESEQVAEDLKFTLVLKFTVQRPPIDVIRQQIIKSLRFFTVALHRLLWPPGYDKEDRNLGVTK